MPANRTLTPGAFDPSATTALVCTAGYATKRRPSLWAGLKLKKQALQRYGMNPLDPRAWHQFTLDHLCSLSLGGLSTLENVWPQPKAEAKQKDRDEARLRRAVCSGAISLAIAQETMIEVWSTP